MLHESGGIVTSDTDPNIFSTKFDLSPRYSQLMNVMGAQGIAIGTNVQRFQKYLTERSDYNAAAIASRPVPAPLVPTYQTVNDEPGPQPDGLPVVVESPWPAPLPPLLVVHTWPSHLTGLVAG
jgi:hypothetical protein